MPAQPAQNCRAQHTEVAQAAEIAQEVAQAAGSAKHTALPTEMLTILMRSLR